MTKKYNRTIKYLEKIEMGKDGIRVFWFEDGQTLDELVMDRFYESEFVINIVGRQYGKRQKPWDRN